MDHDDVGALIAGILASTAGTSAVPVARLDACIEKLSHQMNALKARVFDNINREFRDFHASTVDTADTAADLGAFAGHVNVFIDGLRDKRIDSFIASVAEQQHLKKRLESTRRTNALLAALHDAHTTLRAADRALTSGNLPDAAAHFRAVAARMDSIDTGDVAGGGCDPKIFAALRGELRRGRSQLKSNLEHLWRAAVFWGENPSRAPLGNELRVTTAVSLGSTATAQVELPELIASMHALDLLPERMVHVAKTLHRTLLAPLLAPGAHTLAVTISVSGSGCAVMLETAAAPAELTAKIAAPTKPIVPAAAKTKAASRRRVAPAQTVGDAFAKIQQVLNFVVGRLLGGGPVAPSSTPPSAGDAAVQLFAAQLWPLLVADVNSLLLSAALTAPETQAEDQQQILAATLAFEAETLRLGLSSAAPTALSAYARDAALLTVNRQRQQLLAAARKLLLEAESNTVEVSHATNRGGLFGDLPDPALAAVSESVFSFPTCRVSAATHAFVDLLYTTLGEMGAGSPAAAAQLFFGARDMCTLHRALLPARLAEESDPSGVDVQRGAVFYNDCLFVAHHCLSLGHQHKTHLPAELQPMATFVDMVPLYQKLADTHLVLMVSAEQDALLRLIPAVTRSAGGGAAAADKDAAPPLDAARAVSAILDRLTRLQRAWQGVLPAETYARCVGAPVGAALDALLAVVLRMEDISQADSQALHAHFNTLMQRIPRLFDGKKHPDLTVFVGGWTRFTQVTMLLDLGLDDILSCWRAGQIVLTGDEVRALIKALFANSDLRAKCLAQVQ